MRWFAKVLKTINQRTADLLPETYWRVKRRNPFTGGWQEYGDYARKSDADLVAADLQRQYPHPQPPPYDPCVKVMEVAAKKIERPPVNHRFVNYEKFSNLDGMSNIRNDIWTPEGLLLLQAAERFVMARPKFTGASKTGVYFKWPIGVKPVGIRHKYRKKMDVTFPASDTGALIFKDWCADQGYYAREVRTHGRFKHARVEYLMIYVHWEPIE